MEGEETELPDPSQLPAQEGYMDPWIGEMLSGYHVIKRIGEGGMGIVYLARHQSLDRLGAVKFLGAHMVNDPSYIQRFFQEARAAATMKHPNLVDVYDAGKVGENVYYIVMEYIEGTTLRALVQQRGKLLVTEVVDYIRQAAVGLGYAHRKQIIHRDVKPDNLMLTTEGVIKIGDLGLAKWSGKQDGWMTGTGAVLGTPYYISPEQIRGARDVDARTDIYSLGGTFYHLLTGKIPYEGSSPAVIMAMHLNDPAPDPQKARPPLDDDICRIIQKMLAKKPEDRYQSMEEVEQALNAYQSQKTHPAPGIPVPAAFSTSRSQPGPPLKAYPPAQPVSQKKWKSVLLGSIALLAGFALLAVISLFAIRHYQKKDEVAQTAKAPKSTPSETAPQEKASEPEVSSKASTPDNDKSTKTYNKAEKPVEVTFQEQPKAPEIKPPPVAVPVVVYNFSLSNSGFLPKGVQCFAVEAPGKNVKVGPSGIALFRGKSRWEIVQNDASSGKSFLALTTESPARLKGYFFGASFYLPPLLKDQAYTLSMTLRSEQPLLVSVIMTPGALQLETWSVQTDWKSFSLSLPADHPSGPVHINIGFRGAGRLEIADVKVDAQPLAQ